MTCEVKLFFMVTLTLSLSRSDRFCDISVAFGGRRGLALEKNSFKYRTVSLETVYTDWPSPRRSRHFHNLSRILCSTVFQFHRTSEIFKFDKNFVCNRDWPSRYPPFTIRDEELFRGGWGQTAMTAIKLWSELHAGAGVWYIWKSVRI